MYLKALCIVWILIQTGSLIAEGMVWQNNAFYKINRELKMLMSGDSGSRCLNSSVSGRSGAKSANKFRHMNSVEYYFWMNAVIRADISTVKTFIDSGINVDEVRHRDHPALLLAVSRGYQSVVELLLEGGSNVNCRTDIMKSTALHLAVERNYKGIAKLLLEYGADKNAVDEEGKTALIIAAQKGFLEIAQLLIPKEDYKELVLELLYDKKYQRQRSTEYIARKSKDIMLRRRTNVNIRDIDGTTALMYAIIHGNFQEDENQFKLVQLLLDHKADPNIQDVYGISALIFATVSRYSKVIKLLLKYGALVNMKSASGDTALFYAMGDEEIEKILKEAEAKE